MSCSCSCGKEKDGFKIEREEQQCLLGLQNAHWKFSTKDRKMTNKNHILKPFLKSMCLAKEIEEDLWKINAISYGVIKDRDNRLSVNEAYRLERWYRK